MKKQFTFRIEETLIEKAKELVHYDKPKYLREFPTLADFIEKALAEKIIRHT